jgi:hypothetical protein
MTVISTPKQMEFFRLAQFRAALRLEMVGMRHSSGRSARKAAADLLGLPPGTGRQALIDEINKRLEAPVANRAIGPL